VVDSLKALDPEWPIREADIARRRWHGRKVPEPDVAATYVPKTLSTLTRTPWLLMVWER
jgi:hypothetical protein